MRKLVLMPGLTGKSYEKPDLMLKVLLSLPPECGAFYCSGEFAAGHQPLLDMLRGRGTEVRVGTTDGLGPESLVDVNFITRVSDDPLYRQVLSQGAAPLCYVPYTDELGHSPRPRECLLYGSDNQMFLSAQDAQYAYNSAGEPEVALTPNGGQGAAIGVWREQDAELGRYRAAGRDELRRELEAKTGFRFAGGRPLLFVLEEYMYDAAPYVAALGALAESCDVLVKDGSHTEYEPLQPRLYDYPEREGLFVYGGRPCNLLARFAAGATMAGAFTGSFTGTVIRGARAIPVYTQRIFPWGSFRDRGWMTSFSWHMRSPLMAIAHRALDYLTPLSLGSPGAILDRLQDEDYWRRYAEKLPEIQSYVFGHFALGERAFNRARAFIGRWLATGVMAEAKATLGPCPQLASVPPSWPL